MKHKEEIYFSVSELDDMKGLLKSACKKLAGNKEYYKQAKLYNKNGLQLFKDDLTLMNSGDILYLAYKGS